jgi:hypothetical protein
VTDLSPEFLARLRRCSEHFARKHGLSAQDAQDIEQEAALRFSLDGAGRTIDQAIIDAVRRLRGRAESYKFAAQVLPLHEARKLAVTMDFDASLSWRDVLKRFKGNDRAMIVLKFEWGMELKEIGHVVGMHDSAVCLRLGELMREGKDGS